MPDRRSSRRRETTSRVSLCGDAKTSAAAEHIRRKPCAVVGAVAGRAVVSILDHCRTFLGKPRCSARHRSVNPGPKLSDEPLNKRQFVSIIDAGNRLGIALAMLQSRDACLSRDETGARDAGSNRFTIFQPRARHHRIGEAHDAHPHCRSSASRLFLTQLIATARQRPADARAPPRRTGRGHRRVSRDG